MGDRTALLGLALALIAAVVSACGSDDPRESDRRPVITTTTNAFAAATSASVVTEADLRAEPRFGRLVGWILDHPRQLSFVVSAGGHHPEVSWNEDVVRPLGSTFKTIVLAAYAREVAAGRLDPDAMVPVAEVERWLVEGTDGGSHAAMMDRYGTRAGVSLDDLAAAMMAHSANTATDVLLDRIGPGALADTLAALGLPDLAIAAAPPAGSLGLLSDARLGATTAARLDAIGVLDARSVARAAWERSDEVAAAPRASARATLAALSELETWDDQLRLDDTLPWTARPIDMHELLVRLLIEEGLGAHAARIARTHMSWPLSDPALAKRFSSLAAKEGALPGTLAVHGSGRPTAVPAAGRDRTVVLSIHGLDYDTWIAAVESEEVQALAITLIEDPAVGAALQKALHR